MEEVKTPTPNPTPEPAPTPPPARKLFEPRQRFNWSYIMLPLLVAVAIAGGWFGREFILKDEQITVTPSTTEKKGEPISTAADAYYIAGSLGGTPDQKIYKYNHNLTEDTLVADLKTRYISIYGKFIEPNTYVSQAQDETMIKVLNAATGKATDLFENKDQAILRDVALSADKKWLAYGRNFEGPKNSGEIWLYNTETKEQKQLVPKAELGTYQGYSILGWRNNDKELVVSNLGGDAGAVWGEIYLVDSQTGTKQIIKPVDDVHLTDFITGSLSPDGNLWLFRYCETYGENAEDFNKPCPTGMELRTYDLTTKQIKTIYHNLRYDNNVDKDMLRTVMSIAWQDDSTVVAAVPGAMMEIKTDDTPAKELFQYDRTVPQNFKNNYVQIFHADKNRLVYYRADDAYVFDRFSGKTIGLNMLSRNEQLNHWFK